MYSIKKHVTLTLHVVSRDIRERYAGSYLGIMWSFLYPIFFMLVYWFVFSKIMRFKGPTSDDSYLPFLLSGLFPWFAIQEGIIRGTSSIVEKGYIIKKILLPHELFPISANVSALIHHGIGFVIFLVSYSLWKGLLSFEVFFFLPVMVIIQLIFSIGWSLLLSSIAVYFRDLIQIIGIVLQGIFFLSPILYPQSAFPKGLEFIANLNPLTPLLEGYRTVIIFGKLPEPSGILYFFAFSLIVAVIGLFTFRRLKTGFADVL